MNARVFNRIEARSEDGAIQLDEKTGVVRLPPGTYHITGFSSTIYYTGEEAPEMVYSAGSAAHVFARLCIRRL
jgi:hypothetical protein